MGFFLSGIFLVLWSVVNVLVDVQEYGWAEGNYFWFCNLALFGMGIGLLIRSRGLITGFLSIASFTQTFWLIDNFYRQTTGASLFGLTDFMYRPGYPLSKFMLSHYHYYTLIIGVYVLCVMPKEKNRTLLWCAIFNPLIFAVSYFAFSPEKNVNCIHSSCLPALIPGEGPLFSFLFWLGVFITHMGLAYAMNEFFLRLELSFANQKRVQTAFVMGLLIATGLSAHDVHYRLSLPKFACNSLVESNGIQTGCKNTKPFTDEKFLLSYFVKNYGAQDQLCEVFLSVNGEKTPVQPQTNLLMGNAIFATAEVPILNTDLTVEIKSECQPIEKRAQASIPE